MSKHKTYNSESIAVLEDIEHIRLRFNRYVEDSSVDGMFQLFKEVLDNAVDEHLSGEANLVHIYLNRDTNTITIQDNGRGIPVEVHSKTGISTLTTIFTRTKSGGKFNNDFYGTSAGLHGEGLTVVNALSSALKVLTVRDNIVYGQEFSKGIQLTDVMVRQNISSLKQGTRISFTPDAELFNFLKFDVHMIVQRINDLSFLCPKLKIRFKVEENGKILKHNTPENYFPYTEVNAGFIHTPLNISTPQLDLQLVWGDVPVKKWFIYVNTSPLTGGTPFTYIQKSVINFFDTKANKKLKAEILENLNVFAHLKISNPQFQGQTKHKIFNTDIKDMITDAITAKLDQFYIDNEQLCKNLIADALNRLKLKETEKKDKEAIKSVTKRTALPEKLVVAYMCKKEHRELYLVEGDSAAGTAKGARDRNYQEVLPLRGKIPNAEKAKFANLLQNKEIQSIISAIGYNIQNPVLDDIRIDKLILLMDADPDGRHISSLILFFLKKYLSNLIISGKVYVVDSPLFVGEYNEKRVFGNTKEEILNVLPKATITRLKGHGEASVDELKYYAMSPYTRKLFKITMQSLQEGD